MGAARRAGWPAVAHVPGPGHVEGEAGREGGFRGGGEPAGRQREMVAQVGDPGSI